MEEDKRRALDALLDEHAAAGVEPGPLLGYSVQTKA
jgi:hypothetical protein